MSYYGIEDFDHQPSEQELASELRSPPPRPARRDRQTDASAWQRHIDTTIRQAEHRTLRAMAGALATVLKEERAEHQKAIIALRAEIAELQLRCAALEERQPAKMIAFDKGAAGLPFRLDAA